MIKRRDAIYLCAFLYIKLIEGLQQKSKEARYPKAFGYMHLRNADLILRRDLIKTGCGR